MGRKIPLKDKDYDSEKPITVLSYFCDKPLSYYKPYKKTNLLLFRDVRILLRNIKRCQDNFIDCLSPHFPESGLNY